ncbi:hypothetical protein [Sorangium sp. So ce176]|uniref:hypothetical protein n=1 Tax=Sorangium sp. So ce176 TaxID=3133286 RepID=UPI003F61D02C
MHAFRIGSPASVGISGLEIERRLNIEFPDIYMLSRCAGIGCAPRLSIDVVEFLPESGCGNKDVVHDALRGAVTRVLRSVGYAIDTSRARVGLLRAELNGRNLSLAGGQSVLVVIAVALLSPPAEGVFPLVMTYQVLASARASEPIKNWKDISDEIESRRYYESIRGNILSATDLELKFRCR